MLNYNALATTGLGRLIFKLYLEVRTLSSQPRIIVLIFIFNQRVIKPLPDSFLIFTFSAQSMVKAGGFCHWPSSVPVEFLPYTAGS